jgi:hypothetical protein
MTSDASNLPKHVPTPLIEGRVAPPFDDPVAASLRGFGPLGLLAILPHRRDLCLQAFERHSSAGVGLAVTRAMA